MADRHRTLIQEEFRLCSHGGQHDALQLRIVRAVVTMVVPDGGVIVQSTARAIEVPQEPCQGPSSDFMAQSKNGMDDGGGAE